MTVRFTYVLPTDTQKATMDLYGQQYQDLYTSIKLNVVNNRGLSLALTKLEESAMWLNKAITENC